MAHERFNLQQMQQISNYYRDLHIQFDFGINKYKISRQHARKTRNVKGIGRLYVAAGTIVSEKTWKKNSYLWTYDLYPIRNAFDTGMWPWAMGTGNRDFVGHVKWHLAIW